jgi:hypothetical protein
MTRAVFVKRSIKKNVRGVREGGGSWWNGGGVGEAVRGGEGDEAVDPCLVILNRPWEAGDISKISLAVMACSAGQPTSNEAPKHQDWTYQNLLSRGVYEIPLSDSCRILSS